MALVTPFDDKNEINIEALTKQIRFQIESGTNGLVPCGTTGETPTLSHDEYLAVIEIAIKVADGKIPVIAGCGANSTEKAVVLTKEVKTLGAQAGLSVTPYYNKPTQEGLYQHFMTIADSVELPIVVYNVPGRTSVNILPETVERLSKHPNIVAIKEASGNLQQISEVIARCGEDFDVLSGDDFLTYPIMSLGGKGVISVTANVMPGKVSEMVSSVLSGDWENAKNLHHELSKINQAMFIETNPVPAKTSLNLMGMNYGKPRLPLCEMKEGNRKKLEEVLKRYELI